MPIIRKKLIPDEVYPSDLRYNEGEDTIESFINGEWVENPDADPRHQTTFPPRITAATECDAAQSVTDALKNQVEQIITAIENTSTLFTIAGIILSLFTFGTFGVFISLALTAADSMVGAGSAALEAALTDPVWEQFKCILFCAMDAQGRLTQPKLGEVIDQVNDQIGGLAAATINQMLTLAGEGGINNIAAIGTSEGDCSECDTCPDEWCFTFDFTLSQFGWDVRNVSPYGDIGRYTPTVGYQQLASYGTVDNCTIEIDFAATNLIRVTVEFDPNLDGSNPKTTLYLNSYGSIFAQHGGGFEIVFDDIDTTADFIGIDFDPYQGDIQEWTGALIRITIHGTGDNPFGTDNCV